MKFKYSILLLFICQCGFSQWSTSPYTKDALFACPGFYSDLITYPDGSSIIVGIGDANQIWMQKLDPYGYKKWLPWVSVFPSIVGQRTFLPDDDGGIYAIIGTQAQRVDKKGNLRWGVNGKKIIPNGNITKAVTDGKNGFIALYNHFDSLQRITVFRYDTNGTKLWEKEIDTSKTQNSLSGDILGRLGEKTLIYSSKLGFKTISADSVISNVIEDSLKTGLFFTTDGDSAAYDWRFLAVTYDSLNNKYWLSQVNKYDSNFRLLWSKQFKLETSDISSLTGSLKHLAPDGFGGVFFHRSYVDSKDSLYTQVFRIPPYGSTWSQSIIIKNEVGVFPFSAKGQIGFIFDTKKAQKFDTMGNALWGNNFAIISDAENSYFNRVVSDNNGGAIMSFWTVSGGIWVQHTGRVGKVGVLTKVSTPKDIIPNYYELYQNFPNPFNPSTTISYTVGTSEKTFQNNGHGFSSVPTHVTLKIYDLLGREVSTLVNDYKTAGQYSVTFNGNNTGSGVYFYKLTAGSFTSQKKMILIK
jgi:hypothetical protein